MIKRKVVKGKEDGMSWITEPVIIEGTTKYKLERYIQPQEMHSTDNLIPIEKIVTKEEYENDFIPEMDLNENGERMKKKIRMVLVEDKETKTKRVAEIDDEKGWATVLNDNLKGIKGIATSRTTLTIPQLNDFYNILEELKDNNPEEEW